MLVQTQPKKKMINAIIKIKKILHKNFNVFLVQPRIIKYTIRFRRSLPINWSRFNKNYLLAILSNHIIYYPTPIILTYAWSFGALAGISLIIQMLSGICLAMHYTPHIDLAFSSVEHIMRDVKNGWFIMYVHANGGLYVFYCSLFSYF